MKTINFGGKEFNNEDLYMIDGVIYNCTCEILEGGRLRFFNCNSAENTTVSARHIEKVFLLAPAEVPDSKTVLVKGFIYQFSNSSDFSDYAIDVFLMMSEHTGEFYTMSDRHWKFCRPVPEELRVFGE